MYPTCSEYCLGQLQFVTCLNTCRSSCVRMIGEHASISTTSRCSSPRNCVHTVPMDRGRSWSLLFQSRVTELSAGGMGCGKSPLPSTCPSPAPRNKSRSFVKARAVGCCFCPMFLGCVLVDVTQTPSSLEMAALLLEEVETTSSPLRPPLCRASYWASWLAVWAYLRGRGK